MSYQPNSLIAPVDIQGPYPTLPVVTPQMFGAAGNGIANDTSAINAAVSTGFNVLFPLGSTFATDGGHAVMTDNQTFFGSGTIVASDANDEVFSVTSATGVTFSGLVIEAGGANDSDAILLTSCTNATVTGCSISKHGNAGVHLVGGCSNCEVSSNYFTNAADDSRWDMPKSSDVLLAGSNNKCMVTNNMFASAGGYAVNVTTIANGDHNDYHVISDNIVDGYNSYGILLYRNAQTSPDTALQSVFGCVVSNNIVRNISGLRPADPNIPGVRSFGSGIYVQGAEDSVISANSLSDTNTDTNSSLLAPGAIGVGSVGVCTIVGNKIKAPSIHGIALTDAVSLAAAIGYITVTGNTITSVGDRGIFINANDNVIITGNGIDTVANSGIEQSGTSDNILISDNTITNVGASGVSVNAVFHLTVSDNQFKTFPRGAAIDISSSNFGVVSGNITDTGLRGIYIQAGNGEPINVLGNSVTNCTVGIFANSPCSVSENTLHDNAADYAGSYAPLAALDPVATPDIAYRNLVSSSPSVALTITNLLNGFFGQQVTIIATNGNTTIQQNANLTIIGGDFAMPVNGTITLLFNGVFWLELARRD